MGMGVTSLFDPDAAWRREVGFDRACYDLMDNETGGAGGEIAAAFIEISAARKQEMISAAERGDIVELKLLAHAAKSGAKSLGLFRLAGLCELVERRAKAGTGDAGALAPDLAAEFDAAVAVLSGLGEA